MKRRLLFLTKQLAYSGSSLALILMNFGDRNYPPSVLIGCALFLYVSITSLLPLMHEFTHLLFYRLVGCDSRVTIHRGLGKWYVLAEGDQWYGQKAMVMILVAPLLVTLGFAVLGFICGGIPEFIFSVLAVVNATGMAQDFSDTRSILLDSAKTTYRYGEMAALQRKHK